MEYNSWQSAEIGELVKAISAAQKAMKPAVKDTDNPFFKRKYADLASVWAVLHPFSEQGIAITQSPMPAENGCIVLDTQLSHASGQWMRSRLMLPVAKQDPQGYGSAITYARRYAIGCMCGIVTEEDDDGNAASHPPQHRQAMVFQGKQKAQAKIAELENVQPIVVPVAQCGEGILIPPKVKPADTAAGEGGREGAEGLGNQALTTQQGSDAPPSFFEQSAAVADWSAVIADTNDVPGLQKHWETITKDARLDSTQKVDLFKVYQARVKAIGKKK